MQHARWMEAVALRRDREAFCALFNQFAPRIKAWMLRSGIAPHAADELAQETMLAVWRKAHYYDASRARVSTWIFRIARNQKVSRLRREKLRRTEALEEAAAPVAVTYDWATLIAESGWVRKRLSELPEEQVSVLAASYIEGKSHSEIAAEQGIALGTVKSRLRLALTALRK